MGTETKERVQNLVNYKVGCCPKSCHLLHCHLDSTRSLDVYTANSFWKANRPCSYISLSLAWEMLREESWVRDEEIECENRLQPVLQVAVLAGWHSQELTGQVQLQTKEEHQSAVRELAQLCTQALPRRFPRAFIRFSEETSRPITIPKIPENQSGSFSHQGSHLIYTAILTDAQNCFPKCRGKHEHLKTATQNIQTPWTFWVPILHQSFYWILEHLGFQIRDSQLVCLYRIWSLCKHWETLKLWH